MITKPQNVLILRDIMLSGYVAGCNTRWFGMSGRASGLSNYIDKNDVQRGEAAPERAPERVPEREPERAPAPTAFRAQASPTACPSWTTSVSSTVLCWRLPFRTTTALTETKWSLCRIVFFRGKSLDLRTSTKATFPGDLMRSVCTASATACLRSTSARTCGLRRTWSS